jgi:hypothetical protein
MKVLGIDFTSRPGRRKPITCVACRLDGDHLVAETLAAWTGFEGFEAALAEPGPWIAGLDLPFGQARRFIVNAGWPRDWCGYVDRVAAMSREAFRDALDSYRADRAPGDREHRRRTDIAAGSLSPQKLYGTPVGLMFYEGVPRLRRAGVYIPHLQHGDPERIAVEAYPGLLARQLLGRQSYKHDTVAKQTTQQHRARVEILARIGRGDLRASHGLTVDAPSALADDPGGDSLDALLCAVQAAWAWKRRENGFGAPADVDPLEGWIASPLPPGASP